MSDPLCCARSYESGYAAGKDKGAFELDPANGFHTMVGEKLALIRQWARDAVDATPGAWPGLANEVLDAAPMLAEPDLAGAFIAEAAIVARLMIASPEGQAHTHRN